MIIKLSWFRSLECSSSNIIKAQSVFACMHTFMKKYSHIYIHQANKCTQISSSSIDISSSLSLNKNDKVNPVLYMYILFFSGKSEKRPWTAIFVYITKFHAYLDFVCRCHTKIVNLSFLFILQIVYYNTSIISDYIQNAFLKM